MKISLLSRCLLLVLLSTAVFSSAVRAADGDEDKWQFISGPMLWASGIEGDITIRGRTVDVDLGFDDLLDVTDFGFSTYLELRKKKYGIYATPSYTKLSGDGQSRLAKAEFEQDFWLVEGGLFYNLVDTGGEKPLTLDALAGLRYLNVSTDLDIKGLGPAGRELKLDGHTALADPVVGARAKWYFTEKFSLSLQGDIGGFSTFGDDSSKFSWQAVGLLGFDITKKIGVYGGYRALGIDSDEGSGAKKKGLDIEMHGALLGLQMKW